MGFELFAELAQWFALIGVRVVQFHLIEVGLKKVNDIEDIWQSIGFWQGDYVFITGKPLAGKN